MKDLKISKLEWELNSPSSYMNWNKAIEYAKSLGDGWRLPTRAELVDAYDHNVSDFNLHSYWSSTTYAHNISHAWSVSFLYGYVSYGDKTYDGYYVRCVRETK